MRGHNLISRLYVQFVRYCGSRFYVDYWKQYDNIKKVEHTERNGLTDFFYHIILFFIRVIMFVPLIIIAPLLYISIAIASVLFVCANLFWGLCAFPVVYLIDYVKNNKNYKEKKPLVLGNIKSFYLPEGLLYQCVKASHLYGSMFSSASAWGWVIYVLPVTLLTYVSIFLFIVFSFLLYIVLMPVAAIEIIISIFKKKD